LYATKGDWFGLHERTHVYEAMTGRRIAEVVSPFLSWSKAYELLSFEPLCPSQQPYKTTEGSPLYNFARLTKKTTFVYPQWTLARYGCDSSVEPVWVIKARHWLSLKRYLDFEESGSAKPVGSLDQTYFFSADQYYNAWITKGEDLTLFVLTGLMIDMSILFDAKDDGGPWHFLAPNATGR